MPAPNPATVPLVYPETGLLRKEWQGVPPFDETTGVPPGTAGSGVTVSGTLSAFQLIAASDVPAGSIRTIGSRGDANKVLHGSTTGLPTFGAVRLTGAVDVSGILPATSGGTGVAAYAIGDLLYADTTTSLARLPDVEVGSVLRSGGVGVPPRWETAQAPPVLFDTEPGEEGPRGVPGAPGAVGAIGPRGADGQLGQDGDAGPPGAAGPRGADGAAGSRGADGEPGEDGTPGPPGPAGAAGSAGATGAAGPQGPAVFMEAEQGEEGQPGPTGATGAAGPQGLMGFAVFMEAEQGEEGQPGPTGATGATGAQGQMGPAVFMEAEPGEEGPPGPPPSLFRGSPTALVGLTAVTGVSNTFMSSDSAPAIDQSIAPTWTSNHRWTDNDEVQLGTGGDLRLYHDGTNSFVENDTGKLRVKANTGLDLIEGILTINLNGGTPVAPIAGTLLHLVNADATAVRAVFEGYGNPPPGIQMRHALNTLASPSPLGTGSSMFLLQGASWDSTAFTNGITINGVATETWSLTNQGTRLDITTKVTGTTTSFTASISPEKWELLRDNLELQLGAGVDLRFYHDGTDSFVENDTGTLKLKGNIAVAVIEGDLINQKGIADQARTRIVAAAAGTTTIAAGIRTLDLAPAGLIATYTVTMPAAPIDGQEIYINTSQVITLLTVNANAGQTMSNAFAAPLAAGSGKAWYYDLANTTWRARF